MHFSLRRRAALGIAFTTLGLGLMTLATRPAAAQVTTMVADDITPAAGFAGQSVTGFTFSVANFNAAAVSAAPTVYFYSSSGSGGGPGTLLGGINFNTILFASSSVNTFTYNPGTALFSLPAAGGFFWAGMSFSDGATGTATPAQLNNLGQGIFNPPTVGSSQDAFFQSTAPAAVVNNPAGSFFNFGGTPAANFGWQFLAGTNTVYSNTTTFTGQGYRNGGAVAPVPETSTTVSLGLLLALGMGGLLVASKRRKNHSQA